MKWADARRAGEGRSRGLLGEPKGGRAAARVACTAGRGESRYPRQERESPLFHRPPLLSSPTTGGGERCYACGSAPSFIDPPSYPPPRRGEGTLLRVRLRASFIDPPPYPSPRRGRGTLRHV